MNETEFDGAFTFLREQFVLSMLSVELFSKQAVRQQIPELDEPRYRRCYTDVGVRYSDVLSHVLAPKRTGKAAEQFLIYQLKNVLGDTFEVAADAADAHGKKKQLRQDLLFF